LLEDKHSSLFRPAVRDEEKKFIKFPGTIRFETDLSSS